jgi:polar amino acid transport system substrate-binding protein
MPRLGTAAGLLLSLLLPCTTLWAQGTAGDNSARPLVFCAEPGDSSVWFRRAPPVNGKPSGETLGFSVDLLTTVFSRLGHRVLIRGDLPWSRCLSLVQAGDIDYAFGAYHDAERAKTLAYSKPYKTLTPQIFFAAKHPVNAQTLADLKRYKGCGLHGASYAHYGLGERDLERGVTNFASLVAKLKAGRCDYFPEELEAFSASPGVLANYLNDPELLHTGIEGATAPARHLVAAKGSAAAQLLPAFDAQIAAMLKSGEFMQLWRKNAGDLPF